MAKIKGGYVLKPRKIKGSDISDASPCVRETWDYLIREANHKEFERGKFKIERGQLFRSYDDIIDDLCWFVGWRKETYTKNQMKQAMKSLRDTKRITTQKKPGGVLITICNYSFYQDPDNYEDTKEETNEETIEKPSTNHEQTSHNYKNVKNVKNDNKNLSSSELESSDDSKKESKMERLARLNNLSLVLASTALENLSSDNFKKPKDEATVDDYLNFLTMRFYESMPDITREDKTVREKSFAKWRNNIRLMYEQDGRTIGEISKGIKAFSDGWWSDKCQSTENFRKNFLKIISDSRKNGNQQNGKPVFRTDTVHL